MIILLIKKGNLKLALEIFSFFKPANELVVEKLISALVEQHGYGKEILKIREDLGQPLREEEAEEIILPYLDEKDPHRPPDYYNVPLDVIRAAKKITVMRFLELALKDKRGGNERLKEELYYILKSKM
ncbi:MAG: hypothetical protein WC468_03305 [Candidatus Paceibacterota bacterium]